MTTRAEIQEQKCTWVPPPVKELDEAVWQDWLAKGRARNRRGNASRIQGLKWFLIVVLVAMAGLWPQLAAYDIAFRFMIAAGALILMLQALRARRHTFAALFGVLVLLYIPAAQVFGLAGDWQRLLILATIVPLLMSLAWDKPKYA